MTVKAAYLTVDKQTHHQLRQGNLAHLLAADFDYATLMPTDYFGSELVGVYAPIFGALVEGMRRSVTTLKSEGWRVREILEDLRDNAGHVFVSPTDILPGGDLDQEKAMQRMYLLSLPLLSSTFELDSADARETVALCVDLGLDLERLDEIACPEALESYEFWHLQVSLDDVLPWWKKAIRDEIRQRHSEAADDVLATRRTNARGPSL